GAGQYLGDFIIRPMFHAGMATHEASIAATYAIARAKDYVEGVGGSTHMVVLSHNGELHPIDLRATESMESALRTFDSHVKQLLFSLLTQDDSRFRQSLEMFGS